MPRSDRSGDNGDVERIERILRELHTDDVRGVAPPPEIWAGIETALAEERREAPRRAPSRGTRPRLSIRYRIDAEDTVLADDADIDETPELVVPIAGRTLWSHMAPGGTREIWQMLVRRARSSGREATVPFRCDGPTARRWFEMTVTPLADGGVGFRSDLVHEESRNEMWLLSIDADRDASLDPVLLCAWCGRGEHEGEWLELEDLATRRRLLESSDAPPIDAAVCAQCREEMASELQLSSADS
ncbi:MAG: hypothetical protein AAGA90_06310 [Actinomycetota bacterium]